MLVVIIYKTTSLHKLSPSGKKDEKYYNICNWLQKRNGIKSDSRRSIVILHPEDGPSQQEDVNSVRSGRKQR